MQASKIGWVDEVFKSKIVLSSFSVKFDSDYAKEEKDDWNEVISAFDKDRIDYVTKDHVRTVMILESFTLMEYYSAVKVNAGIIIFYEESSDTFYVGLIDENHKEVYNMLFHKLFMENNSNRFIHLRREGTIAEDYKPVKIEILKKAA